MIPKIIHYSWFSGEPIPAHIQELMATWQKFMPDYEYVLWDGKKIAGINNTFANEAISVRKWAFASDFLRLYVVYHYGGIWFDTDIEVFKSFDSVLDNRMFIGREANMHGHSPKMRWLTAHCFGAEKGHPFIKDCLDFYTERHFIRTTNKKFSQEFQFDLIISPEVMATVARSYDYNWDVFCDKEETIKESIHIFPSDYFDSPRYKSMKRVFSIHRAMGGWRPGNENYIPDYSGSNSYTKGKFFFCLKTFIHKFLNKIGIAIIKVSK